MSDRRDEEIRHASAPAEERTGEDEQNQGNGQIAEEAPARHETSSEPQSPPPSPPPPRGPKLWVILAALAAVLLIGGIMLWIGTAFSENVKATAERVEAVLVGSGGGESAAAASAADNQYWTCGMHPWVILPDPGNCPICHMPLTPLDPAKLAGEIAIDPVTVQNIGVRIAPVATGPLTREVRTVGTVAYNEAAVRDVNTKVAGWIEELYVDETGVLVEQGQPLFELYSPELYAAQREYLSAYRNRDQVGAEFVPEAAQNAIDLVEAARTRLEFFDISEEQIQRLQETGEVQKTLTIASPHTGIVIDKHANEGMRIEPGMRVYRIADLSTVWVQATVYEQDLPYVEVGQQASMTLPYLPGEVFKGEVAYIYPYLNEQARAVKVRLEFPNPEGLLKPGMFATVQLERTLDEQAILAPRAAVIGTGEREIVFVSLGEGRFEPREVDIGVHTEDGMVEVLDGLKPGERIVTSGQFLLDSESKIRSALAKMVRGNLASEQEPPARRTEAAPPAAAVELPAKVRSALGEILTDYMAIEERLITDTIEGIAPAAQDLAAGLDALVEMPVPGQPTFWKEHSTVATARGEALELVDATDLKQARLIYADLSAALADLFEDTGVPLSLGERLAVRSCPMFPPGEGGAVWLQRVGPATNPYMGSEMLRCSSEPTLLPAAGGEPAGADPAVEEAGEAVPAELQQAAGRLTAAYLAVQQMLAQNEHEGVDKHLEAIRAAATELAEAEDATVRQLAEDVIEAAERQPEDLASLRAAFKSLSQAVVDLVERVPPSESIDKPLYQVYCPMAQASWLQTSSEVHNPYYGRGHAMYDCGELRNTFEATPSEKSRDGSQRKD